MKKYSDIISWLAMLIGIGLMASVAHSMQAAVPAAGVVLFAIGLYRLINNSKRKEMLQMFFSIEQLPEDTRKTTIEELKRKTKPETWHWKLVILLLLLVIFGLLYFLLFTYFEIKLSVRPRPGLWH